MEDQVLNMESNQNQPEGEDVPEVIVDQAANTDPLFLRVQAVIDEVKPFIQSDGGNIELLKVEDNIVYVRLFGACIGCPSSMMTLKGGVEARMREEIPEIEAVEMV